MKVDSQSNLAIDDMHHDIEAVKKESNVIFNDGIPKQFHFEEYKELDEFLTQRYGLPFTYKRLQPDVYHPIEFSNQFLTL